jgi:hypothetical protein
MNTAWPETALPDERDRVKEEGEGGDGIRLALLL